MPMTHLSKALKKYYSKEGNKLVFRNNLSLNQLALEMWERLGYQGIDASVLSRVINGERLFTLDQLNIFCDVLRLNNLRESELMAALEVDYINRFGLKNFRVKQSNPDLIDVLSKQLKRLKYTREKGHFTFAMDWSADMESLLSKLIRKESKRIYRERLLDLLGETLYEKGYISGSTYNPKLNLDIILPLANKMFRIARIINSSTIAIKSHTLLGFAYYSLGKYSYRSFFKDFYKKNMNEAIKALKIISDPSGMEKLTLICWRHIAISSIYLKDEQLFDTARNKILMFAKKKSISMSCSYLSLALHTVARGESSFKNHGAIDTLDKSKQLDSNFEKDPLREASMIRNEIEILRNLNIKDQNYISKLARHGLAISKEYTIGRFQPYFNKYL